MNADLRYSATRLSPVNEPITKDMVIREVRDRYPGITAVFQAHGLPCAGCHVGSYETIAGGARTHNLDVEAILADLNTFVRDGTVPPARGRPSGMMAQAPKRGDVTIEGIKHIIAVASGKGGVGKSLVTALLAVTLKRKGYKVGILDGDITGPSIPRMFGVPVRSLRQVAGQNKPNPPLSRGGMPVMSMNVLQQLPTDGAVLVSTPQGLATMVVSKAIQMVKKFEVPIVGLVENMSYVELPDGTTYEMFGPSKGQRLVAGRRGT